MKLKFILVLLIVVGVSHASDNLLPQIKIKDLQKKVVKTDDLYKDGPILINFWSLSCEPCKKEMVHLDKFNQQYAKAGFRVMSINIDSPRSVAKVKSYVKAQKFSFPVFLDPKAEFFRKTGGKVMPYILIVTSAGEIVSHHMGYNVGDEKSIEEDIQNLLKTENEKQLRSGAKILDE